VGLLKSLLDEAGVPSEIRNENVHSMFPGASLQPEIWVLHEEDYLEARRICDEWRETANSEVSKPDFESDRQPSRAFAVGSAFCGLCFLGMAVLARSRFRMTGDAKSAIVAVLLGLIASFFIWLAVTTWTVKKTKT